MIDNCHFIGIGGIGMSGLARLLLAKNRRVSGSDLSQNFRTEELSQLGAKIAIGHAAQNIPSNATVIFNSDIKKDNPEYIAATQLKYPILHRSDLLQLLMDEYKPLAVTGTHGKTTTTSLLASTLIEGGLDPSYAIGGYLPQFHTNAGHGNGEYFVAEADESDGTFLKYHPYGAIVTNIDLDHLDHFREEAALVQAFQTFMGNVQNDSLLFWCGEDARLSAMKNLPGISYGFQEGCLLQGSHFRQNGWSISFDAAFDGKLYRDIQVALTGYHNALNALAVFGLSLRLGVAEAAIRRAFIAFGGVQRRCEKKGEAAGILFLDDYAHHPTEIAATLKAIRAATTGRRLVAVYQPHRYSRIKHCLGLFSHVFDQADVIVVTQIYGAGETPILGLSHQLVAQEIGETSRQPCLILPRQSLAEELHSHLKTGDVVVSLGAGDITKLASELLPLLSR